MFYITLYRSSVIMMTYMPTWCARTRSRDRLYYNVCKKSNRLLANRLPLTVESLTGESLTVESLTVESLTGEPLRVVCQAVMRVCLSRPP